MGMFDTVFVPCPKCGEKTGFQSKAGLCQLANYTLGDAPADVLADIAGETEHCDCGESFRVVVSIHAWAESTDAPGRHGRIIGRDGGGYE
jgi:hypothetical protein